MSDAIKKLHDYLAKSPSVVYPEDVLAYLSAIEDENAELRDSLKALMMGTNVELCADRDQPQCRECSMYRSDNTCVTSDAMELLGIDMYGEPL